MALPCFCYKCIKYKELKSIKDPHCLSMEERNCEGRDCDCCDFSCQGFTDKPETGKKSGIIQYYVEV
ncbi:MAG: hypothetical protein ACOY46_17190 [Bacillota bacterium]